MINIQKMLGNDTMHQGVLQVSRDNMRAAVSEKPEASQKPKPMIDMREFGKGNKIDVSA
jgi:hypothetical protein